MTDIAITLVNRTSDQHPSQVLLYASRPHGERDDAPAYQLVDLGPDESLDVTLPGDARYFAGVASAGPGELAPTSQDALEVRAGQTLAVTGSIADGLRLVLQPEAR
jgi:hypothetical protein